MNSSAVHTEDREAQRTAAAFALPVYSFERKQNPGLNTISW